jgi:ureidoglycolate lyase
MAEVIRLEPLTREAFAPFGEVLDIAAIRPVLINNGLTEKFDALAHLAMDESDSATVCIYRSQPIALPFRIRSLERHLHASQAFFPLQDRPFPVVVARPVAHPQGADLRAFMAAAGQGVCLRPGAWHHHQLSLGEVSDYLVLESSNNARFTETISLAGNIVLEG